MNDLIQYARKVEGDMYEAAKDKVLSFVIVFAVYLNVRSHLFVVSLIAAKLC